MSLLTVEAKNFLIHKDLKINLDKESAIIIGDSGVGKSTLSRLILAHIAQGPYPANPLSYGENEGHTKTTHQGPDGKVYTVSRKYTREENGSVKLDRFEVRGPAGKEKSLEHIMGTVFNGVFTNARFDYNTYFNKKKGAQERYKYFVDAIGGKTIEDNIELIEAHEEKRAAISGDRDTQKALWKQGNISEDPAESAKQLEKYNQERTIEEAATAKEAHLAKRIPLTEYETKLDVHAKAIEMVKADEQVITSYKLDIQTIDQHIMQLQRQRAEKEAKIQSREASKVENAKAILTDKQLNKLQKEVIEKDKKNQVILESAEKIYTDKVNEIVTFQTEKAQFFNGLKAFDAWYTLDNEWNDLDKKIADLKVKNEETLKKLLPLPELSIGIKNKKPVVLYKGREFSDEYLSTGEQIEITAAIQVALNPTGDNFIVIPNAQDLGSKLKDVQAACKKFNVQYLVEMTRPDEEFRVELIDSEKETI